MGKRVLVALGGNAIKKANEVGTYEQQLRAVRKTAEQLAEMVARGYELVITHGNGPQVGNLLIQQEEGIRRGVPPQPLDILNAMTQGQIGYMLQQSLQNALRARGMNRPVITVVTQVLVRPDDPDFRDPSKPVGPFYTREEAEKLAREKGYRIKKVKPTGEKAYRRVVPSPDPIAIVEGDAIRSMVDTGMIVIASGGGGIPVVEEGGALKGVEAVIDKDLAGEKLAEVVGANVLLILTDVRKVKLNFGRPDERDIDEMTIEEARRYMAEGHFPPGSMGPKVKACIRFLEAGGELAIIAHLDEALEALEGRAGTRIYHGEVLAKAKRS
ncbi:carbamate kinase [Candidatus Bathyarchaeota archaeon ex4484_135]|nr:MAG: carbamate kinase [Candidatus Bathyarchaeota archaeon ex4484_135]